MSTATAGFRKWGWGLLRLTSDVAKNFRKKSGAINYKIHRVSAGVFHSFGKIFLCHRKAKSKGDAAGGIRHNTFPKYAAAANCKQP